MSDHDCSEGACDCECPDDTLRRVYANGEIVGHIDDDEAHPTDDKALRAFLGDAHVVVESDAQRSARLRGDGPRKVLPAAHSMTIRCVRCNHCNSYSVGTLDPTQARCTHRFTLDRMRGRSGLLTCTSCELTIERDELLRLEVDIAQRYDHAGNALADAMQRLREENRTLLVENALLRRAVEQHERNAKKGQR